MITLIIIFNIVCTPLCHQFTIKMMTNPIYCVFHLQFEQPFFNVQYNESMWTKNGEL